MTSTISEHVIINEYSDKAVSQQEERGHAD